MAKRDYYEVLGSDRGTDEAELKRAYRRLAMQHHPDRNPDDPEAADRMKEVNEAYAVLSDPQKRQIYDTYGHNGLQQSFSQEDLFSGIDFSSLFSDLGLRDLLGGGIFGGLFGGGGGRQRARKGADLRYDLEVTLEQVATGIEETIEVTFQEECASCRGVGAENGGLADCQRCRGQGQVVQNQQAGSMVFRQVTTCPSCRGRGQTITKACKECHGAGLKERTKELTVEIPHGADTGNAVRVTGEGALGPAGPGDLFVVLHVLPHEVFQREENDLIIVQEIDFATAALGGAISVPGLDGEQSLTIAEGTQASSTYKIAGGGMPHLHGSGHGDEYVVIKVVTPTELSEEERELFQRLAEIRRPEVNGRNTAEE
ncbi:MAG: molecular chaperone DnaJ [Chloroflexi bacterium]|jgi:molecular chaperone DnaJ|nr:MAG: molecular chaperone DnaJ [Chloroflexota bacterium]